MLSSIDIFATPVTLNFNKQSAFSSTLSGITSIIVLLIMAASSAYFFETLSNKSNPSINSLTVYPSDIDFKTDFTKDDSLFISFFFENEIFPKEKKRSKMFKTIFIFKTKINIVFLHNFIK